MNVFLFLNLHNLHSFAHFCSSYELKVDISFSDFTGNKDKKHMKNQLDQFAVDDGLFDKHLKDGQKNLKHLIDSFSALL